MARIIYPGATPIKLIIIVVTAGAKITRNRILIFSARIPINGLNRDGIRWITDNNPANERFIDNLSINKGRIGARKEVYIS